MKNVFSYSFIFIIVIILLISIFGSVQVLDYSFYDINPDDVSISSLGYTWPIPNNYRISSYFGYRDLNLFGASSYHSGIDIPSPEGTYFLATMSR